MLKMVTISLGKEGIEAAGLGGPLSIFRKPMSQKRMSLFRLVIPDSNRQRFFGTHHDYQFFASGHGGINQISLKKDIMLEQDGGDGFERHSPRVPPG